MSQVECAHCGETGLSLSARCPACEQRVCLRCRKASTPTDCNSWHVANEDGGPSDSGSGSEPPACMRLAQATRHGQPDAERRCVREVGHSGRHRASTGQVWGEESPPVGPLQALRDSLAARIDAEADWARGDNLYSEAKAAEKRLRDTDAVLMAALVSVEEQLAALQRENADDLKVENARMRPWYPKTEVGGGSSPSSPKGDA